MGAFFFELRGLFYWRLHVFFAVWEDFNDRRSGNGNHIEVNHERSKAFFDALISFFDMRCTHQEILRNCFGLFAVFVDAVIGDLAFEPLFGVVVLENIV